MADRILKPVLTALLGLMALIYVIQNVINLQAAYTSFDYVLGMKEQATYPRSLFPPLGPSLSHAFAWLTFFGEFATGALLMYGAWRLWDARGMDARGYARAAGPAKAGAGLAVITWFGLFCVGGGAAYQMWQTEIGSGSMNDAFKFSVWGFLLLIYLGQRAD